MTEGLSFPLEGRTFIAGPSGVGKTRLTARALEAWLGRRGPEGVAVLEFGPEIHVDGRLIGRRLDRFVDPPDGVWTGTLEARGPRTEGRTDAEAAALAEANAEGVRELLEGAPRSPTAVFVNDVTIAAHHELAVLTAVLEYCDRADCAVVNGYAGEGLGGDDPISRRERRGVRRLRDWADRTVRPDGPGPA